MYSIPYPQSSTISPIKVPYVARYKYSLSGPYDFINFPEYAANLCGTSIGDLGIEAKASLVQSWLFFGLASEALGRDVDHEEFLDTFSIDGQSQGSIDIRICQWFWVELTKRLQHLRATLPNDKWKETSFFESLTYTIFDTIVHDSTHQEETDETLNLVYLSVRMLHSTVTKCAGIPSMHDDEIQSDSRKLVTELGSITAANLTHKSTQLLVRRMIENGWCKKRLNVINSVIIPYPCLYFLSSIPPSHGKSGDHSSCTFERCSVNTAPRAPLHRDIGCQCQNIPAPMDQVYKILEEDGLPLVRIKKTESGFEIEVVKSTNSTIYTAISHVWADLQLGSKQNELPRCQVEYLYSTLSKLPIPFDNWGFLDKFWPHSKVQRNRTAQTDDWLFWLDTFCNPQDDAHDNLKRKSLDMMNLVYANATQTLVLDLGLQDFYAGREPCSLSEIGPPHFFGPAKERLLDALAHILGSNWMGRAWTLQEGVLSSRSCVVCFQGSFATIGILRKLVKRLSCSIIQDSSLFRSLASTIFYRLFGVNLFPSRSVPEQINREPLTGDMAINLLGILKASLDIKSLDDCPRTPDEKVAKFIFAHKQLQSRSTTNAEDLPLLLTNLSGLKGNFISRIGNTDERMRSLLYTLERAPLELLFSNCGRIGDNVPQVDGWIPRTVVAEEFSGKHFLVLGEQGFKFELSEDSSPYNFFLLSIRYPLPSQFILFCDDTNANEKTYFRIETLPPIAQDPSEDSEAEVCIMVDQSSIKNPLRGAQFLITSIIKEKVFVRYTRSLRLWRYDDSQSALSSGNNLKDVFNAKSAAAQYDIILERCSSPEVLLPRPQHPRQYHQRIDIISLSIYPAMLQVARPLIWKGFKLVFKSDNDAFIALFLVSLLSYPMLEQALHYVFRHNFISAHRQSLTPNGLFQRILWKYVYFHSPISQKAFTKTGCILCFSVGTILTSSPGNMLQGYAAIMFATLVWLILLFDLADLRRFYTWLLLYKAFPQYYGLAAFVLCILLLALEVAIRGKESTMAKMEQI